MSARGNRGGLALALADGFVEEDGGGDADIEGVQAAKHGDENVGVGGQAPPLVHLQAQAHASWAVRMRMLFALSQAMASAEVQATTGTVKMAPMLARMRLGL